MTVKTTALKTINKTWTAMSEYLSVPHDEAAYKKSVSLLDSLIDVIGNDEKHPAAGLLETVGLLVSEYEKQHIPVTEKSGIEVLKFLMDEHGLKQSDLKEIGSQGVVSEIMSGKRSLNIRQIKKLAGRFNVNPAVFIV